MRKKYTKLMVGLTVLIVCLALLAPAAMAAETIYVSIRLTGDVPQESENYVVVLKADNPAFPMPEGSENGEYKLVITGEDMGNFPQIQYSSVGIYTYTVYQVPGSNELGNYDSSIYHVTVYVLNASADGGFEHMVTLRKDDHEEKFD